MVKLNFALLEVFIHHHTSEGKFIFTVIFLISFYSFFHTFYWFWLFCELFLDRFYCLNCVICIKNLYYIFYIFILPSEIYWAVLLQQLNKTPMAKKYKWICFFASLSSAKKKTKKKKGRRTQKERSKKKKELGPLTLNQK